MAGQQLPDDFFAWLADLDRRLVALERSPQLTKASIKDGSLDVYDATGILRVRIGKDGTDYGVKVYDAAGANAVSLDSLARGQAANFVLATETTASATYTDLATVGPAATATIGPSGRAFVTLTAAIHSDPGGPGYMSFAVSGATTLAATDNTSLLLYDGSTNPLFVEVSASARFLVTGLTPGSNTFTAKYRAASATVPGFARRHIIVEPF